MFFLSTVAAMGAEEWQKTWFKPENSYFTLFSPKKHQYKAWPNAESDFINGMFFLITVAAMGAKE